MGSNRKAVVGMMALFAAGIFNAAAAEPRLIARIADKCVATPWPPAGEGKAFGLIAALGPIILPGLFDKAASFLGARLRSGSEKAKTVATTQTSGHFLEADYLRNAFRANRDLKCLIVLYGEIGSEAAEELSASREWSVRVPRLQQAGLSISDIPAFYYEGIFAFSDGGETFKIATAHLEYSRTFHDHKESSSSKELAISFLFEDQAGHPFAEGVIPLGELETGVAMEAKVLGLSEALDKTQDEFDQHATPILQTNWMPTLAADLGAMTRMEAACDELGGCPSVEIAEACIEKRTDGQCLALEEWPRLQAAPFSMTVQVAESSNQSAMLDFLADTIEIAKPLSTAYFTNTLIGTDGENPFDSSFVQKRNEFAAACGEWKSAAMELDRALASELRRATDAGRAGGQSASRLGASDSLEALRTNMQGKLTVMQRAFSESGRPVTSSLAAALTCRTGLY